MLLPNISAMKKWVNNFFPGSKNQSQDFLQLARQSDGTVLGWIDETGTPRNRSFHGFAKCDRTLRRDRLQHIFADAVRFILNHARLAQRHPHSVSNQHLKGEIYGTYSSKFYGNFQNAEVLASS
jgi:hypothetical protein